MLNEGIDIHFLKAVPHVKLGDACAGTWLEHNETCSREGDVFEYNGAGTIQP